MRSPLRSLGSALARGLTNQAPLPYTPRGFSRLPFGTRTGAEAQMRAMGSVSTLFAIVNRTAKAEARVTWRLYRKAASGRAEDRTEVIRHAALDLWGKPNRFYTQNTLVEAGAQHKLLTGEQWWVIARHPRFKVPLELWPVRPDRIGPIPDPEEFISGYMYRGPGGEQVALRLEDVIWIRTPHPLDPYRGIGPVQALLTDLDAVRYSAEWNRNFFLNSAEPGGIIEVPQALSDPEFDQLRERWNEQHKGVANAHRVAILEHGRWVDRKFTQRDMQFAELRGVSREIIREAFGFPKSMLGSVDDVNRANAEAGNTMFAEWLIVPEAEAIKDALNHQYLPLFGEATAGGLEFDYDSPVPKDREADSRDLTAKAGAASTLVTAGWDPGEVTQAVGLPDMRYVGPPRPAGPSAAVPAPADAWGDAVAGLLGAGGGPGEDIEAAMRWEAVEVIDDNTCDACRENNGKLYRNRADAYKDYPGGSGYVHCTGSEYGNECRGKVIKRRKGASGEEDSQGE